MQKSQIDQHLPAPGQVFNLCYTLSNQGFVAGGGFIQITIPQSITLSGATLSTADGRQHYYQARQLYQDGQSWHIATGSVVKDYEREVCWLLFSDSNTPIAAYPLRGQAGHYYQGQIEWGDAITNTVYVGGYGLYAPFIFKY